MRTPKYRYAYIAFMLKRGPDGDGCRVGDLFPTRAAAEKAIQATWAFHEGRFDEMSIYRQRVSLKRYEETKQPGVVA